MVPGQLTLSVLVVDWRRGGGHTRVHDSARPEVPDLRQSVAAHDAPPLLASGERLTPWMIHDLPRIAWIVEYRAGELTGDERQIVRDATARMLRALELDSV